MALRPLRLMAGSSVYEEGYDENLVNIILVGASMGVVCVGLYEAGACIVDVVSEFKNKSGRKTETGSSAEKPQRPSNSMFRNKAKFNVQEQSRIVSSAKATKLIL